MRHSKKGTDSPPFQLVGHTIEKGLQDCYKGIHNDNSQDKAGKTTTT